MALKRWLVTVVGECGDSGYISPPFSRVIRLKDGITPLDWYLAGSNMYYMQELEVTALISFWELLEKEEADGPI